MQAGEETAETLKKKREGIDDLLKRKFFLRPAFDIYEGVSGLYDYGPPGCAVKKAFEDAWRRHFVLEEDMFEVSCTNLTPEICLKASGHVDRFSDFLVREIIQEEGKEPEEGQAFRADKLIEDFFEAKLKDPATTALERERIASIQAASLNATELHRVMSEFNICAPGTTHPLSFPEPFNLMFATTIGPTTKARGFLRPETAQGIFVNFKFLYELNGCKLPFAAAQIGLGFRNEIAPRDGLLRVREFAMAEIEHFVNPANKAHPKFGEIAAQVLKLYPRQQQATGTPAIEIPIGEAVSQGLVNNETLGYFMTRTFLFLLKCGIQLGGIRFRQHMADEMSHYAKDCWDAEIYIGGKWVECVGIADRHCFDLTQHAIFSKKNLLAAERCNPPKRVEVIDLKPNKAAIGGAYKAATQGILKALEEMCDVDKESVLRTWTETSEFRLLIEGNEVVLSGKMLAPARVTKEITQETFYPSVIEPSFGIGRILWAIFDHVYKVRADGRAYFSFPPHLAPVKCSILPLSSHADFKPVVRELRRILTEADLSTEVDESSVSIGRRYARTDEIGIPFACTIDFQTLQDQSVTLRELNSMRQVRLPMAQVAVEVTQLVKGLKSWGDTQSQYPEVVRTDEN